MFLLCTCDKNYMMAEDIFLRSNKLPILKREIVGRNGTKVKNKVQ